MRMHTPQAVSHAKCNSATHTPGRATSSKTSQRVMVYTMLTSQRAQRLGGRDRTVLWHSRAAGGCAQRRFCCCSCWQCSSTTPRQQTAAAQAWHTKGTRDGAHAPPHKAFVEVRARVRARQGTQKPSSAGRRHCSSGTPPNTWRAQYALCTRQQPCITTTTTIMPSQPVRRRQANAGMLLPPPRGAAAANA